MKILFVWCLCLCHETLAKVFFPLSFPCNPLWYLAIRGLLPEPPPSPYTSSCSKSLSIWCIFEPLHRLNHPICPTSSPIPPCGESCPPVQLFCSLLPLCTMDVPVPWALSMSFPLLGRHFPPPIWCSPNLAWCAHSKAPLWILSRWSDSESSLSPPKIAIHIFSATL